MRKTLAILLLAGTTFLTGCGDSENFVFTNPNNPIPLAAPVCADDAYTTNENTQLSVSPADGVLSNDTPNGGTVTAFDATSTQNGTVNVNGNGGFTYTPANGFTGSDSFTYTVSNASGQATCTVTITVVAVNGFFVDAANGNDTTGDFDGGLPFATIQAAVAAAPTNADIVVRPGNYTGTVNLKDGQRLLGSGSALVNSQSVARPQLTGPVVLADGNTLDFLRIEDSPGDSVDGIGQEGATVTNCQIVNSGGEAIDGNPAGGTWIVSNNSIMDSTGLGVWLTTTNNVQMNATVNGNTITGSAFNAIGFTSENTSQCTAQVHNNIMTGNQAGATFEVIVGNSATFCLDLENNQNDDVYRFDRATLTSTVEVEEFATPTIPSNTGTVVVDVISEPITAVADGACGF